MYCVSACWKRATTWTLTWFDAASAATDVRSGALAVLIAGTPFALTLSITPTLIFQANINGSNVGAPFTVTVGSTSAALVASLSGASARWKLWAANGNAYTMNLNGVALS